MNSVRRNILIAGTLGCLLAAAYAGIRWAPNADQQIPSALYQQRPASGRLYRAGPPGASAPDDASLAHAQVLALSVADPDDRDRIQSLIDTARGRWPQAVAALTRLNDATEGDPELLNDLAMATAALGRENAVNYFKALDLLEKARKMAPESPAPVFNMLQIYRSVGLRPGAMLAEYERIEKDPSWRAELKAPASPEAPSLMDDLRSAVNSGDEQTAARLLQENFNDLRQSATDYALSPPNPDGRDPVMEFIAERIRLSRQDESLVAMMKPLRGGSRQAVVEARTMVRAGVAAYRMGNFKESLSQYDRAAARLKGTISPFDRMWIDLSRADTYLRAGQRESARPLLDRVIAESRKRRFLWVLGQALAALGADGQLLNDFQETQSALAQSIEVLDRIGASEYMARPLYYMSLWQSMGGDVEGSLNTALRCLRLTREDDHTRLTQVYWLIARSLRRMNFLPYAIAFQEQGVSEAETTNSPMMIATSDLDLASLYRTTLDYKKADRHLSRAMEIREKVDPRAQHILDYNADLICGRIQIGLNNPKAAATCLERNIENLRNEPRALVSYLVPSLTLLARARLMLGDVPGARELFNRATRAVESDDDYLVTEKSRLSFDNERRELYESVIAFEYAHNDFDAAWGYLQQYRSKLFLEFLGQVNPAVAKVRHDTFRSDSVQKLIPSDAQVVEYFMLKDQLIIWVASRDRLLPTMVPIDREALERRIGDLVSSIRRRDDVNASLADLYELLIAPVERHLDSSKALAIIPDQALHRLPFAALKQASSDKYLIEKYTILESPNLTTLLASAAAPERNVVRSYGSPDGAAPVGAEVLSFGGLYPDVRTFGGAVSKDRFLADLRIAAIFHYGGHTVDAPDPLNSAILLDGDRVGPNSLTAAEISRQRLRPNAVVVLASCDSSVGNFRDGVSLRGLTSAFLIAGAGTVAGSLWPVEEVSASSLMRSFHEAFARNVSGAESMRQAQTSLMTRNPRLAHPYYWSGFVVNGNLSAVR